ncbi:hypothetical protein KPH14_011664 [Odynerus spinipes]|uniref:Phospholipase A2 n=1 Tax=Odynerus spinipes TaxID=1348599 RepID=A0AAD9RFA7_9HYME|nr:hypothetical protein KPH14_011664 [Odynerus spinipes]
MQYTRLVVLTIFILTIEREAVENTTQIIEKGVNNIISKLPPSLRDHIEGNVSKGKRGFGDVLNLLSDMFRAIYPGTLWCGAGDIAENEQDLGLFERTDACCRDHDNCFNGINAGEEKDGLLNNGIFTRSHCSCDSAFNECLKNVHSIVATKIGITYFEILSPQCFADDYPIINCRRYSSGLIDEKCVKYDQDYKAEKKLQWFDNPIF